jgi:hypothetical protein
MWVPLVARQISIHVWFYREHSVPYAGFQVLKVVDLDLVDYVLHITTQEKIQWG